MQYVQPVNLATLDLGCINLRNLGPDLLTACASANPLLALKNYCQELLNIRHAVSEMLALTRHEQGYFYG